MKSVDYSFFTSKQETDTALNTFVGIVEGIIADGKVNSLEREELKQWITKHQHLSGKKPIQEVLSFVDAFAENKFDVKEFSSDFNWFKEKVLISSSAYYDTITQLLQELNGYCHGILSDGAIKDEEVVGLYDWLDKNQILKGFWPFDELSSLVLSILSDGHVDEEERVLLKKYLFDIADINNPSVKSTLNNELTKVSISAILSSDPQVSFSGKRYVFTGNSILGSRFYLKQVVESLGGVVTPSVSSKTDFLVVAANINPCWAFSCYGRKVEKAMNYRKQGYAITIVDERDWWDEVLETGLKV